MRGSRPSPANGVFGMAMPGLTPRILAGPVGLMPKGRPVLFAGPKGVESAPGTGTPKVAVPGNPPKADIAPGLVNPLVAAALPPDKPKGVLKPPPGSGPKPICGAAGETPGKPATGIAPKGVTGIACTGATIVAVIVTNANPALRSRCRGAMRFTENCRL